MQSILNSKTYLIAFAALFLSGCATTAHQLPAPAGGTVGVQQVRVDAQANVNKSVRWGGMIVDVENTNGESRVEIVAQPLLRDGQPDFRQASEGRFIAVFDQFLEPNDYKTSSQITVLGVITGTETGEIGQADYEYPVVGVTDHQLWRTDNRRYAGNRYGGHNSYYGRSGFYGHNGFYGNAYYGGFFPRFSILLGSRHGRFGFGSSFKFGGRFGRGIRGGFGGRGSFGGRGGFRGRSGFAGRGGRR